MDHECVTLTPLSKIAQVMAIINNELRPNLPKDSPLRARTNFALELLGQLAGGKVTVEEKRVGFGEPAPSGLASTPRAAAMRIMYDEFAVTHGEMPAAFATTPDVWATIQACLFAEYLLSRQGEFAEKIKQTEKADPEGWRAWEEHLKNRNCGR